MVPEQAVDLAVVKDSASALSSVVATVPNVENTKRSASRRGRDLDIMGHQCSDSDGQRA